MLPLLARDGTFQTFATLSRTASFKTANLDGSEHPEDLPYELPSELLIDEEMQKRVLRRLHKLPAKRTTLTRQAIIDRRRAAAPSHAALTAPGGTSSTAAPDRWSVWSFLSSQLTAVVDGPEGASSSIIPGQSFNQSMSSFFSSLLSGRDVAMSRFRQLGLEQIPQAADGSCQFRSLSHQLFGDARYHLAVRSRLSLR